MVKPLPPDAINKSQALYWITRLNSGECTDSERRAFETWLVEREEHRQAYEEARWVWDRMEGLKGATFPEIEAARDYRPFGALRRPGVKAAAAALGVLAGGIWMLGPWGTKTDTYRTVKGEQQSVVLADGTRVEMNTDTELDVLLGRNSRTVTLHRGEAAFTIAHNDDPRPFEVVAGSGRVRDLGTEFAVSAEPEGGSVVVVEGLVEITTRKMIPQRLSVGERVTFNAAGDLSPAEQVDPGAATAWRSGRLVFKGVSLAAMVAQLARYHDMTIEISDPALSQLVISGTFKIHDIGGIFAAIEATLPVKVSRPTGGVVRLDAVERAAAS
jgi:transmembrane sensor